MKRPVVLLIHGGGWAGSSPVAADAMVARYRVVLRRAGFAGVAVDPAPGAAGLGTVLDAIDATGAVGLWGESSGGHLALVASARRPGVAWVLADSAPTDLQAEGDEGEWPRWRAVAHALPDGGELSAWNPLELAGATAATVSLVHAREDPVIPFGQAEGYVRAAPDARLLVLEAGPEPWVHCGVEAGARERVVRFALDRAHG